VSEPQRLSPDRWVAVVGYRFTSRSRGPKVTHDAALLLLDAAGGPCPFGGSGEATSHHRSQEEHATGRLVCAFCRVPVAAWDCSCESFTLGGRECPHIQEARRLWAEERRR
jgi:hypothetical protein